MLYFEILPDASGTPSKVVPVFGFPFCSDVLATARGCVHDLSISQYEHLSNCFAGRWFRNEAGTAFLYAS